MNENEDFVDGIFCDDRSNSVVRVNKADLVSKSRGRGLLTKRAREEAARVVVAESSATRPSATLDASATLDVVSFADFKNLQGGL